MPDVLATLKKLPEECFARTPLGKITLLKRGVAGHYPVPPSLDGIVDIDVVNAGMGCNKAQREAMLVGSMMGWHVPGADPDNYDENGKFRRRP